MLFYVRTILVSTNGTTIAPRYFFVFVVVATILLYTIFIINNVQHIEDVICFSEST